MKIEKISKYVLWACMAVALIGFVLLFVCGETEDPATNKPAPNTLDLFMYIMAAMVVVGLIGIGAMLGRGVTTVLSNKKQGIASSSGVPAFANGVFVLALTIGSFILGAVLSGGSEAFVATDGTETSAGMVAMVNTFCISILILFIVAVASILLSMSGLMSKIGNK